MLGDAVGNNLAEGTRIKSCILICCPKICEKPVAITATDRKVPAEEGEKALCLRQLENDFSFSCGQMLRAEY
jgi:hypothetical protein